MPRPSFDLPSRVTALGVVTRLATLSGLGP
jgi:hypothetical protein